jgi:hypothetical protein
MIYVKAAIAGVAAVFAAGLVAFAVGISALIVYSFKSRNQETGIGWDIVAFTRSAWAQLIGLLAFIAGFIWEYRRVSGN